MYVQEETIDLSCGSAIEEFLRRCKDHGRKALCVQQALGGVEHAGIVIYDGHDLSTLRHEMCRLPSERATKPGADFLTGRPFITESRAAGPVLRGTTFGHSPRWTAQGLCEIAHEVTNLGTDRLQLARVAVTNLEAMTAHGHLTGCTGADSEAWRRALQ
jgi:hypothetical protein